MMFDFDLPSIAQLDYTVDSKMLKEIFSTAGKVKFARVLKKNGKSRGIGIVRMETQDEVYKLFYSYNIFASSNLRLCTGIDEATFNVCLFMLLCMLLLCCFNVCLYVVSLPIFVDHYDSRCRVAGNKNSKNKNK